MYGVVLWSDPEVRRAVIWCEDQGRLAYYEAPERQPAQGDPFFIAGDYVEFDVTSDANLRRAQNAQTVRPAAMSGLSGDDLVEPASSACYRPAQIDEDSRVIRLSDRFRTAWHRQPAVTPRG